MTGVILAVIVSNWIAHHLHPDGLYEAELEGGDAACYYLRQARRPLLLGTC
jgi:chloride channel 7